MTDDVGDDAVLPAVRHAPPLHLMTRDDLVASVAMYRAGARSRRMWLPGLGVPGGLGLGLILTLLAEWRALPAVAQPLSFGVGWAVAIASMVVVSRRNRQLLAECQWTCPACDAQMIAPRGINPTARAEVAIASGRCPSCGERLFGDDG